MQTKSRKPKTRPNGTGCAFIPSGRKTWTAQVVVGYKPSSKPGGQPVPDKRRKGGFRTKKEALAFCAELLNQGKKRPRPTLQQVFDAWAEKYAERIVPSTMAGYKAAYKHFSPLHSLPIIDITAQQLQDCMDACPAGKRTRQMMKVTSGLIWGFAFGADYLDRDITKNLYTGKGHSVQREPLTPEEVRLIRAAIDTEPYAEYVYALCYLGFRPGEFLALKKSDLHQESGLYYLVGGSKTEAGINRPVPVPVELEHVIAHRLNVLGTDLLFPMACHNRRGDFTGYKEMSDAYFRESVFKPLMERLGIAPGKVPYSARHTYADKLKEASGSDKSKAAVIGHTDYTFTQKRYQSTTLDDIKPIADTIK